MFLMNRYEYFIIETIYLIKLFLIQERQILITVNFIFKNGIYFKNTGCRIVNSEKFPITIKAEVNFNIFKIF